MIWLTAIIHTNDSMKPSIGAIFLYPLPIKIILTVPILTSSTRANNISSGMMTQTVVKAPKKSAIDIYRSLLLPTIRRAVMLKLPFA
jgi:hypothetical protein